MHFQWVNQLYIYIDKDWAIFNSYVNVYQRVLGYTWWLDIAPLLTLLNSPEFKTTDHSHQFSHVFTTKHILETGRDSRNSLFVVTSLSGAMRNGTASMGTGCCPPIYIYSYIYYTS